VDRIAIHHIGIAVDDLDGAIATYASLFGGSVEHRDVVPDQGVEAASVRIGPSRVELLRPLGSETPVGRFVAGRGPGLHHVAFEVADLDAELARLRADSVELIDEEPRLGLFGLQVAFIHPQATGGVLAELVSDGRG
jgi:methylmalonyl-CoA epimerase